MDSGYPIHIVVLGVLLPVAWLAALFATIWVFTFKKDALLERRAWPYLIILGGTFFCSASLGFPCAIVVCILLAIRVAGKCRYCGRPHERHWLAERPERCALCCNQTDRRPQFRALRSLPPSITPAP